MQPSDTELYILTSKEAKEFWDNFSRIGPNGIQPIGENGLEASLKVGVKSLDVLTVLKESRLLGEANNLNILAHGGLGHGLCQIHLNGASKDVLSVIKSIRNIVKL